MRSQQCMRWTEQIEVDCARDMMNTFSNRFGERSRNVKARFKEAKK